MSTLQLGALAGLGAFHGLNPAMGWLFAVAIGLQRQSRAALTRSLGPIAVGHGAAVALTVALIAGSQAATTQIAVRVGGALLLVALAAFKLLRSRSHPAWVGMNLRPHELAAWSFLMSSAHGAGLMLLPVVAVGGASRTVGGLPAGVVQAGLATAVHTLAMLAVMAAVAVLVYEVVGLRLLRTAWIDLDRLWAVTLLGAAALTLTVG